MKGLDVITAHGSQHVRGSIEEVVGEVEDLFTTVSDETDLFTTVLGHGDDDVNAAISYRREVLTAEDVLGDAGTGGAPSLPLADAEFGPGTGGTHYTDAATIRAVQKALIAKGISVGKKGADGEFGPETEDAIFRFGGVHGPPDDAMLAKLGVVPGGPPAKKVVDKKTGEVSVQTPAGGLVPVGAPPPTFLTQPLWKGAPVKVWQAGLGVLGFGLLTTGLAVAVRHR